MDGRVLGTVATVDSPIRSADGGWYLHQVPADKLRTLLASYMDSREEAKFRRELKLQRTWEVAHEFGHAVPKTRELVYSADAVGKDRKLALVVRRDEFGQKDYALEPLWKVNYWQRMGAGHVVGHIAKPPPKPVAPKPAAAPKKKNKKKLYAPGPRIPHNRKALGAHRNKLFAKRAAKKPAAKKKAARARKTPPAAARKTPPSHSREERMARRDAARGAAAPSKATQGPEEPAKQPWPELEAIVREQNRHAWAARAHQASVEAGQRRATNLENSIKLYRRLARMFDPRGLNSLLAANFKSALVKAGARASSPPLNSALEYGSSH